MEAQEKKERMESLVNLWVLTILGAIALTIIYLKMLLFFINRLYNFLLYAYFVVLFRQ